MVMVIMMTMAIMMVLAVDNALFTAMVAIRMVTIMMKRALRNARSGACAPDNDRRTDNDGDQDGDDQDEASAPERALRSARPVARCSYGDVDGDDHDEARAPERALRSARPGARAPERAPQSGDRR